MEKVRQLSVNKRNKNFSFLFMLSYTEVESVHILFVAWVSATWYAVEANDDKDL